MVEHSALACDAFCYGFDPCRRAQVWQWTCLWSYTVIGCTNRRADSGIPQTQAGRSGSRLGARRPSSRATAHDYPSATPTLRHRSTPPPQPPRPVTRLGPVPPIPGPPSPRPAIWQGPVLPVPGRHRLRSGRDSSIYRDRWTTNTGRRASPVRSCPWGLPWLLAGALGPGVGMLLPSNGSHIRCQSSDQGCCLWISGSFVTVGTAGSIRPSRNLGMSTLATRRGLGSLGRCHRGPVSSCRVPSCGAHPGHCFRAWIAGGSDTDAVPGHLASTVSHAPQSSGPRAGGSANGPGLVSTAVRPQVGGPGRPGHTPALSPGCASAGGVLSTTHLARYRTHQSADGSSTAPTPDSERAPAPWPGRPPRPAVTRTKPRSSVSLLRNQVMRFILHEC